MFVPLTSCPKHPFLVASGHCHSIEVELEVSHRITRRTTRPVARVVRGLNVVDVDRSAKFAEVNAVSYPILHDRATNNVGHP